MGMFDDTDIYLLALDTDKDNGNFARLKAVQSPFESTTHHDFVLELRCLPHVHLK